MKKSLILLVALTLSLGCFGQKTKDKIVVCTYLIDGLFFENLPESFKSKANIKTVPLNPGNGGYACIGGILSDGQTMPDSIKALAVPANRVANSKIFLDQYATKVVWLKLIDEKSKNGRILKKGMKLDKFSLKDFSGTIWDNNRIKGHVTVINVWYSGCGACLDEMPEISKWKEMFPDVYFLSVDYESKEKMKKIVDRRGFTWTHLYDDRYFTTWVSTGTTVTGYPLTIVLDKDSNIVLVVHGTSVKKRNEIVEEIKKLKK